MFDEVPIRQTTVAGGSSTSIQRTSTHEVGEELVSSTLVSCNGSSLIPTLGAHRRLG